MEPNVDNPGNEGMTGGNHNFKRNDSGDIESTEYGHQHDDITWKAKVDVLVFDTCAS